MKNILTLEDCILLKENGYEINLNDGKVFVDPIEEEDETLNEIPKDWLF